MKQEFMLEKVSAYLEHHQLLPEEGEIVVAVSGGTDSLCLLDILRQLCGPGKRFPTISLRAAHLNHLLRGEESYHDARAVAQIAASWQIPCTLSEVDVLALARAEKRSLEEAARLARYRFLREVARGQRIAVAHHADDQVETLLLHWLRGSGLTGQVGMAPRQQDIIRPLLEITRAETVAYCLEHKITPVEDHSNNDPRFLRNRIRHEVLPLLQELNPGIQQTLLRNAEIARIDLDWLETQVEQHWASVVISEKTDSLQLDSHALLLLPFSLQRHLLRRVSAQLYQGQSPLEPRHLLLIEQLLKNPASSSNQERLLHLPQRLQMVQQGNNLLFRRLPEQENAMIHQPEVRSTILPVPGTVQLPGTPWQISAELLPENLAKEVQVALQQEHWPAVWGLLEPVTPYAVYIDGESIGNQLLIRTRKPGDRIQPLGMYAEKKVQDIFIDNHIGRTERNTLPLFFSDLHCVWIAGACLDHRVRLTAQTRRIIHLAVQPL
jgi:tRNA(Ile)-lysidine synthase